MSVPPREPPRWREDPTLRPPNADAVLRSARPRPPAGDLARMGASVDRIARLPQPGWLAGWKLASATAGVVAVATGGVFALRAEHRHGASPPAPPPLVARADDEPALAPGPEAPAPAAADDRAPPRPAPQPAVRAPSVHLRARPHPARASSAPVAADQLQREIRLIDAARAALPTSPARALAVLDDHQRAFPSGQLAAEREFLAVEALRRMNRGEAARRRAEALLARFPSSPYAERAKRATEADRGGSISGMR